MRFGNCNWAVLPICSIAVFAAISWLPISCILATSQNWSLAVACKYLRTDSGFLTPASSTVIIPLAASKLIDGEATPNLSIRVLNTWCVLLIASCASFLITAITSSLVEVADISFWEGRVNKVANLEFAFALI